MRHAQKKCEKKTKSKDGGFKTMMMSFPRITLHASRGFPNDP